MNSLTLKSPAKLNLCLRVLRRRPDNYHDLGTFFHRISLADTLRLSKRKSGIKLRCSDPSLPTDEKNLIVKAYRKLQQHFPELGGVSVFLKKKIPVGAGLGGGSSNAAFFLIGMKKLYGLSISQKDLLEMGASLGADIPFFLHQIPQGLGVGRGDQIKTLQPVPKLTFLLAASPKSLSTRDVYEKMQGKIQPVTLTKVSREIRILCAFLAEKNFSKAEGFLKNDLELSAFELRPSLRSLIKSFKEKGMILSRMTGSGPTVFGVLSLLKNPKRIVRALQNEFPQQRFLVCHSY